MPGDRENPPQYTRYRARRRLLPVRDQDLGRVDGDRYATRRGGRGDRRAPKARTGARGWRGWSTKRRIIIGLLAYGIDRLLFWFQRGLFPYRTVEE